MSRRFSNDEIEILFKLRSKTTELKSNFKKKYFDQIDCSIKGCSKEETQEHIFSNCPSLLKRLKHPNKSAIDYNQIFSSNSKLQHKAVIHFNNLMDIRAKLIKD